MRNAVSSLKIKPEIILVDGNHKIPIRYKSGSYLLTESKKRMHRLRVNTCKSDKRQADYQYAKVFRQYLFKIIKDTAQKNILNALSNTVHAKYTEKLLLP
jgi:hypothetical protein